MPLDFTDEQKAFAEAVREFCRREVAPRNSATS